MAQKKIKIAQITSTQPKNRRYFIYLFTFNDQAGFKDTGKPAIQQVTNVILERLSEYFPVNVNGPGKPLKVF